MMIHIFLPKHLLFWRKAADVIICAAREPCSCCLKNYPQGSLSWSNSAFMYSCPEEDRMQKMSSPAVRRKERESHAGKKKRVEERKSFNVCDHRLWSRTPEMASLILLRACGVCKRIEQWKQPIDFINVNGMLYCWRKRHKILCFKTKYNLTMFSDPNETVCF